MTCRLAELRQKEIICVRTGARLGFVGDVEVDTENARLASLSVYGRLRWFGFLGREEDLMVRWEDIELIGEEAILVRSGTACRRRKKNTVLSFFTE